YNKINGEPGVGLLKDNFYLTKTLVTNTKNLYNLKSDSTDDVKQKFPSIEKEMDSLLSGFYHSTKYLYFNNKKVKK
ncbi:MAG: sulfatase, partial [Tenacibaculum sp.]